MSYSYCGIGFDNDGLGLVAYTGPRANIVAPDITKLRFNTRNLIFVEDTIWEAVQ